MADLWKQFPDLAPSAIRKVLRSLESKGLVGHAGDESQSYVGGVHWWSTAMSPTHADPALARIEDAIEAANLGVKHHVDPAERHVTLTLPLVELEGDLQGLPSKTLDRLRSCIRVLEADGASVRLTISEITTGTEPVVHVKLAPASF